MKYQIYKITNLLEPQRVYIGMTSQTLKRRFISHCTNKKSAMYEPIQRTGKEHFTIIPIDHAHEKREAYAKEEFWTLFYKEQGYTLYNRNYGSRNSDETRRKLAISNKGKHSGELNPMYGKHHTAESRQRMSNARQGKALSEEVKRKFSELRRGERNNFFGKHHTQESKEKMQQSHKSKNVVCIETGKIFRGLHEAERQTNINSSSIMRVCKGRNKTAGGYHWRYVI